MAGALGVRVSGPRIYGDRIADEPYVNAGHPDPTAADIGRGLSLYKRAMAALAVLLLLLALGGAAAAPARIGVGRLPGKAELAAPPSARRARPQHRGRADKAPFAHTRAPLWPPRLLARGTVTAMRPVRGARATGPRRAACDDDGISPLSVQAARS